MLKRHYNYFRPSPRASDKLAADARAIIEDSLKLLRHKADTFLGRQTYKPFPSATEDDKNNTGNSN